MTPDSSKKRDKRFSSVTAKCLESSSTKPGSERDITIHNDIDWRRQQAKRSFESLGKILITVRIEGERVRVTSETVFRDGDPVSALLKGGKTCMHISTSIRLSICLAIHPPDDLSIGMRAPTYR